MMKRFTFLLTLLLLFTTNLCAQDNTFIVEYNDGDYGLKYQITDTRTLECKLLGFDSNNYPGSSIELSIPEKASNGENEYSVTAIAGNAFSDDFSATFYLKNTLTIPATVVTIGANAFEYPNISKLIILYEGNDMVIGNGAFAGGTFTYLICKAATPPNVGETNPFLRNMHIFVNDPEAYKEAWGLVQGQNYPYYKQLIDNYPVSYGNYSLVFNYNTNYESLNVKLGDAPTAPCSLTIPSKIVISGTSFNVTAIAADGFANEYCSYFTNVLSDSETAPTLGTSALSGFNQTNKPTLYVRGKLHNNDLIIDESYGSWIAYFNEIENASVKEDYTDYKYSIVYSITDLNNKKCAINKFICGNESVSYPLNLKNTVKILEEDYTITTIEDLNEGEGGQFNEINFPYNSSISYIGSNAFSSSTLKELFLPESISYIGNSAFKFASSSSEDEDKTKLIIYGNNTKISNGAFDNGIPSGIYVSSQYYDKYIENPYNIITNFMPYYGVYSKGTGSWKMYNKDNSSLENIENITNMNVVISAHYEITNNVFDVASYYVMNNESASLTLDMDNGQLISGSRYGKDIIITKSIVGFGSDNNTKSGWYTISSPLNTNVDVTDVENLLENTYDLYSYVEAEKHWLNYKQGEGFGFNELEVGHGYLYANSENVELTFTGIENTKDVNVGTLTFTDGVLAGMHLVGNPFTHNIYKSETKEAAINNENLATGYYVLGNAGEWTARTNTQAIKAGEGFLIKTNAETDLTIKKDNKEVTAKSSQDAMLKIDLSGKDYQDVAYVTFSEAIGLDKINHRNENIPMVYIPIDGINYAIASVDSEIKEIPLCVEVKNMGEYTIGIKAQDCTLEDIILVDLLTGKETNMLTDTYSFIAKSNENPNRFMIKLDNSQGTSDNSHFIYISNEELIINNIEGQGFIQIYDILGRPVAEYNVSSSANIPTASFSDGVYVVRMIDENGIKVQKVIID